MRCFVSMGQWSWPKELTVINCVLNITALQSAFWLINGKCKVCKGQGCPRPLTKANAHSLLLPLHRQRPRPIRTGDIFVWNALWWPPYLELSYRSNGLITATNPTKSGIFPKHSKLLKIGLFHGRRQFFAHFYQNAFIFRQNKALTSQQIQMAKISYWFCMVKVNKAVYELD